MPGTLEKEDGRVVAHNPLQIEQQRRFETIEVAIGSIMPDPSSQRHLPFQSRNRP